jgi:hypothetical protein
MRFKVVRAASNVPPVPEGGVLRASDMFDDIVPTAAREYKKAVARIAANVKTLCNEGIIEGALIPGDVADSLEFYGDAVLHLKITRTLRSMYGGLYGPGGLHQARMSAEQRHTLAKLYDDMNLGDILPARSVECMARDEWKLKGDFIEALVGELESKLDDAHGVHRDHPHRELVIEVIDRIVKALILNGQYLRSSDIRKAMIKKASRLE